MLAGHTDTENSEKKTRIERLPLLKFSFENSKDNRLEIQKIQQGILPNGNLKDRLNSYQLQPIIWGYVDKYEKFIFCPNSLISVIPENARQITLVLFSNITVSSDVALVTTHKLIEFIEKT